MKKKIKKVFGVELKDFNFTPYMDDGYVVPDIVLDEGFSYFVWDDSIRHCILHKEHNLIYPDTLEGREEAIKHRNLILKALSE